MTVRRAAAALLALALIGSACSKKEDAGTDTGKAKSYTVQVDAHTQGGDYGVYASAYFPSEVKVHPGDTVSFKLNWSGEPHSVTFGTLVDEGAAKLDPAAEDEPEAWKKIPSMLPDGPGDAIQSTVNPCFLDSGAPPEKDACTADQQKQPAFTGKQAFYNSGFLSDGSNFSVKFDATIAPGTYNFFCALHRGIMMGKVSVVAAAVEVPAPAEVLKQGNDGVAQISTKLKATFDKSKSGMGPGALFAGTSDPAFFEQKPPLDAGVTEFLPKTATAKVGAKVKFVPVGAHSVTFNAPQDAVELLVKGPDGAWHMNPKAAGPAQSPPTVPSDKPVATDAGTWNGTGFLNSGILLGFGPPGSVSWTVTFGKAGTYAFRCVVHPDMEGSITVS